MTASSKTALNYGMRIPCYLSILWLVKLELPLRRPLLFSSMRKSTRVARAVTTSLSRNALFIVDVDSPHVKSVKTLMADDLRSWTATGTKTSYFREPTKLRPLTKVTDALFGVAGVYRYTRSFYCNTSEPDLKRVIISLKGKYGSFS